MFIYEYIYSPTYKSFIVNCRNLVETKGEYYITEKLEKFGRKYRFKVEDEGKVIVREHDRNTTFEIFVMSYDSEERGRNLIKKRILDYIQRDLEEHFYITE